MFVDVLEAEVEEVADESVEELDVGVGDNEVMAPVATSKFPPVATD
jgi:hypothetical protein